MQKRKNKTNAAQTLTDAYLWLMATVFLLFPGFSGYGMITRQKWLLFVVLSDGYLLTQLVTNAQLRQLGRLPRTTASAWLRSLRLPQLAVLAYLFFTLLSSCFSVDAKTAFFSTQRYDGFVTIALYVGVFLAVSRTAAPKKALLWSFAAAVTVCCIICLMQLAGNNPLKLYPLGMDYYDGGKRYAGMFLGTVGNLDLLAAVLCIAVPVFWICIVRLREKMRFLLLIPIVMSLYILIRADALGGLVGIFGGALLTVPAIAKAKKTRRLLWIAVGAFVLLAVLGVYLFGSRIGGSIGEAAAILHGELDDDFGSGRIYIWRNVLPLVKQRPLLGGGPDTLWLRTDARFVHYDEALEVKYLISVDNAHNEYLNILLNQGAFALIAYLTALASGFILWLKNAPENPEAAVFGGAVCAYCIQSFFGLGSPNSSPYFWIAFALLLAAIRQRKEE